MNRRKFRVPFSFFGVQGVIAICYVDDRAPARTWSLAFGFIFTASARIGMTVLRVNNFGWKIASFSVEMLRDHLPVPLVIIYAKSAVVVIEEEPILQP